MGYPAGFKGYKLFDPQGNKFLISRDVVFHEDKFPYHHLPNPSQPPDLLADTVLPKHIPNLPDQPIYNPTLEQPETLEQPDQPDFPTQFQPNTNPASLAMPILPQVRRSSRSHRPPSYLQNYQSHITYPIQDHLSYAKLSPAYREYVMHVNNIFEPQFFHQAVTFPEWRKTMAEELAALEANNTWTVQTLPPGKITIGCKWVYKAKLKADGSLDRYKARLVAQGFTQQAGIDFQDTFSPVAKLTTVRLLLSIAAQLNWNFLQLDINNAFLNGELREEVYMKLPKGYPIQGENIVCMLNKSLYGLRQASRQWFHKFSSTVLKLGFVQSTADHSLFSMGSGPQLVILLVYVDDIILAGPDLSLIHKVQTWLEENFKLKIIGDLKYFLGLEIAKSTKGIHLCQRKYAVQLLQDTGYISAKRLPIPMDPNIHLNDVDGDPLPDVSMYRRLIGRLMYLTISRPDITFAVNRLSQFLAAPRTPHLNAVHHLLQYIKGTPVQGIFFPANSSLRLSAYVDAEWGSCQITRKSTSGFCIFLGESLVAWKSKKQPTVARSSAEAEYRALAALTSELLWIKQLLRVFEVPITSVMIFCDSNSAIQLASNPPSHERSKHIDIDCHFIREHVGTGFLNLVYVPSHQQLVDPLTEALPRVLFQSLISKLGLLDIYLPT